MQRQSPGRSQCSTITESDPAELNIPLDSPWYREYEFDGWDQLHQLVEMERAAAKSRPHSAEA